MEQNDNFEYIKCGNEFTYCGRQFNGYTSQKRIEETLKFEFLPSDIVIMTFPKSGTTVVQEIVWQIMNRKITTLGGKCETTLERMPFLEFDLDGVEHPNYVEVANSQKSESYRILKTHLPYEMIKENIEKANPKQIVVMRNAKDCLVSTFYFYNKVPGHQWSGTFDQFFPIFLHGKTFTGDYFDNNLEWWSLQNRSNILIIKYEDIIQNITGIIEKIAAFLNQDITEEDVKKVAYNSSFSVMSKNKVINIKFKDNFTFLRKGVIGDWKNHFSEDQNKLIMQKIHEKFDGHGLDFIYE